MKVIKFIIYSLIFLNVIIYMPDSVRGKDGFARDHAPVPVDSVKLEKYAGLWYEIAKIPNRFQRKCVRNTTAQYRIRADSRLDVVNRCTQEDGTIIEAKGIAKIVDSKSNARLKVSFVKIFGISLFWGDYWIIGLDENYQYAVVGTPSRKYGWILSRKPRLSSEDWEAVSEILRKQGYDPGMFDKTLQEGF